MLKFVNSKIKKEITGELKERFGIPKEVFDEYHFLENEEKIWICSKSMPDIDFKNLRFEGIGMLFARKGANIKPTTNMVQLFGKHATKNIVELDESKKEMFIRGLDIPDFVADVEPGYVVVKHKKDCLGCSLYKDGHLKNQIPKQRRIKKMDF